MRMTTKMTTVVECPVQQEAEEKTNAMAIKFVGIVGQDCGKVEVTTEYVFSSK